MYAKPLSLINPERFFHESSLSASPNTFESISSVIYCIEDSACPEVRYGREIKQSTLRVDGFQV